MALEKNPVLDHNRPASGEEHNVISQLLPWHLGRGLGVESREEEERGRGYSLWTPQVMLVDHGNTSKCCVWKSLVKSNIRSSSSR